MLPLESTVNVVWFAERIRVARHLRVVGRVRPALHDVGGVVVVRCPSSSGVAPSSGSRSSTNSPPGCPRGRRSSCAGSPRRARTPCASCRGPWPGRPGCCTPRGPSDRAPSAPDTLVPGRVHHRGRPRRVRERPVVVVAAHVLAGDAVVPVVADLEPPLPDRTLDPGQVVRQRRVDVRRVAELRDPAPGEVVAQSGLRTQTSWSLQLYLSSTSRPLKSVIFWTRPVP
jgi:hypothetical protein